MSWVRKIMYNYLVKLLINKGWDVEEQTLQDTESGSYKNSAS